MSPDRPGALLAASAATSGHATLSGPLRVATAGYLLAIALSWLATSRPATSRPATSRPAASRPQISQPANSGN